MYDCRWEGGGLGGAPAAPAQSGARSGKQAAAQDVKQCDVVPSALLYCRLLCPLPCLQVPHTLSASAPYPVCKCPLPCPQLPCPGLHLALCRLLPGLGLDIAPGRAYGGAQGVHRMAEERSCAGGSRWAWCRAKGRAKAHFCMLNTDRMSTKSGCSRQVNMAARPLPPRHHMTDLLHTPPCLLQPGSPLWPTGTPPW